MRQQDWSPQALMECIRPRLAGYFPAHPSPPPELELVGVDTRTFSRLHFFRVVSPHAACELVVKIPLEVERDPKRPQEGWELPVWLQLVPWQPPSDIPRSEFDALRAIESGFAPLGDDRFGIVRALDLLPEMGALVMERVEGEPLSRRLASMGRRGEPTEFVRRALRHSGSWLRHYQGLPASPGSRVRLSRRDEVVAAHRLFWEYLASTERPVGFFREVGAAFERFAERRVPEELAVGRIHGDFWPGNVLVGSAERVTVIDSVMRASAPVQLDVARFLRLMMAVPANMYSGGRLYSRYTLAQLEAEFLLGYYGGSATDPLLDWFRLGSWLHDWARAARAVRTGDRSARFSRSWRLALKRGFYRRAVRETVGRLAP